MATRPVFIPATGGSQLVEEIAVEFEWFPGFALSQKQKSIAALHASAQAAAEPGSYLEISSKSDQHVGQQLSAFNLLVEGFADTAIPVECAFQGSKVFESGGPYTDLYTAAPLDAKRDPRVRAAEPVAEFRSPRETWPNIPRTAFYDWLYVRALTDRPDLIGKLLNYSGFTDIEFNPARSLNCQARSCALAVSLVKRGLLVEAMQDRDSFIDICYPNGPREQPGLF